MPWKRSSFKEGVYLEVEAPSQLQSPVCQGVPRTFLVGDFMTIKTNSGVTQNDTCANHRVSLLTLLTTLLTSGGQWPSSGSTQSSVLSLSI